MTQPIPHPMPQPARLKRMLLLAFLVVISALVGFLAYQVTHSLAYTGGQIGSNTTPFNMSGTPLVNEQGTPLAEPLPAGTLAAPLVAPTLAPWDGAGRVTILLLGLDFRDWEAGEKYARSDTMILLTMDPQNKTAGMLSIPRDMWVSIPGFKHGKINTAYFLGDAYQLPGGGPGLAVKTVEQFLGIPINYYAQVDFNAFVRVIDEIGGVKINVPEKITIELTGGDRKKTLQPGVQVLPGEWALAYARARHTEGGDFDRANRQQQVIMAIRDRVLSLNMLPTLVSKANTLYQELAAGIQTNLAVDQAIKLAFMAQDISTENIQKGVLGKDSVLFGQSPDGLSILIPIPDKIHLLRNQIFASTSSVAPLTPGTLEERLRSEAARVAIYNGSSVTDLGQRTAAYLQNAGVTVSQLSAADRGYSATVIVDHTGNPYTVQYFVELMKISSAFIYVRFDPASAVDVEVYLGENWASNSILPNQ